MGVTCNLTAYEVSGSTNVANNTTNVYVKLTATTSGTSHNNYGPSGTITIDGTTYSYSKNIPKTTTTTLYEATHTISHNSDGKKSIGISYSFNTGISAGTLTGSKNLELSTVPRTSSVTCADGNIGSSTTININRASTSFTHTLKYSFGGLSGTIVTKTSNTSIGWTIPTSFYAKIPNAKSGQGTITCETYSGSTLVGTSTCTFNATVLETSNKATLTATVIDVNETTKALTGDANKLIKYFSNAKVTMTATAKNSATIKSQKVVCGGKSSTSATSTLNNVESGTFNISCTDSRGFSTSSTITKTIVNYIKLAITSLTIERESSTSNTVKINCKGNYFNASFGSVANTLTLKWRYRLKGGTWSGYTSVTATKSGNTFTYAGTLGTNFDYQQAYEFEVAYVDKLISDSKVAPVTAGEPLIDMWKDNVKVNANVRFTKEITANGSLKSSNTSFAGGIFNGASGSAQWVKIGTWSNMGDNDNCIIKICSGNGYNGGYNQNTLAIIQIKNGWQQTQSTSLAFGLTCFVFNPDNITNGFGIRGMAIAHNKIDVWLYCPWGYWNGNYVFEGLGTWTNANVHQSTEPTEGVKQSALTQVFQSHPNTLYDNSSGTTGTVTLSDSAANYSYLEIFYIADGANDYGSVKVNSPNGKQTALSVSEGATILRVRATTVKISGATITPQFGILASVSSGSTGYTENKNYIKTVKVLGYK